MDKNEILEKSRAENRGSDERDKLIELNAYRNAHWAVMALSTLLFLIAFIHSIRTVQNSKLMWMCLLFDSVSDAAMELTRYRYDRKRMWLVFGIGDIIATLVLVWLIVIAP